MDGLAKASQLLAVSFYLYLFSSAHSSTFQLWKLDFSLLCLLCCSLCPSSSMLLFPFNIIYWCFKGAWWQSHVFSPPCDLDALSSHFKGLVMNWMFVFPPPPPKKKFICQSPNPPFYGIWRWSLPKVIRFKRGNDYVVPMMRFISLQKEATRVCFLLLHHMRTHWESGHL